GMYLYKGLYITAVLYAAFLVLAIDGLRSWRRARADAAVAQA
ncbi:MAG: nicotinamide riboside transporter PnuC, partial [Burkholderiaceae bacterium]